MKKGTQPYAAHESAATTQKEARGQEKNIWYKLQTHMRRRRFRFVRSLLHTLPPAYTLLDVGGTQAFWQQVDFQPGPFGEIVLYNLTETMVNQPGMTSMIGDARHMEEFPDKHFDVIFSNSVIEHVGTYQQQEQMAREIQRVGRRYCIQTPNRNFPIEPHVLWPCFQFLPRHWQVLILMHIRSPWGWRIADRQEAERYIRNIRLLDEKELRALFPGAQMYCERFLGLKKSFFMYHGW